MQKEAIQRAETLFRHVATTYFENQPSSSGPGTETSDPTGQATTSSDADGWLASLCSVNLDEEPMLTAALGPKELFEEELDRYIKFEGGWGELGKPLAWWKVRHSVMILQVRLRLSVYC